MYLELCCNPKAVFLTLTYNDENLPSDRCLHKRDLQLFLKRLRKLTFPRKVRYYACGEYGEKNKRPHYHAICYNLGREDEAIIQKAWKLGFVYLGDVNHNSISYVASYVNKKQVNRRDDSVTPEFSLMSLRPAIGADAIPYLVDILKRYPTGDIPPYFLIGGKKYPIPRYLRNKLLEVLYDDDYIEQLKAKGMEDMQAITEELVIKHFGKADYLLGKNYSEAYSLEYKQKRIELEKKKTIAREKSTF